MIMSSYADDMVLLAPSWAALQYLVNVLEAESVCINMSFNKKKPFVLYSILQVGIELYVMHFLNLT